MHKRKFTKPDGRELTLYSLETISDNITPTNPKHEVVMGGSHMRWHPMRGEWVCYASHRQNRTFLPPKEFNPLAPTTSSDFPTELPAGKYDMAVFENLYASFDPRSTNAPSLNTATQPGKGACEVVVFSQNSEGSLGGLSLDRVELLLRIWADRYKEIPKRTDIKYILPFENRGVEVGVTLHHPHGQIYAYPFVPPVAQRMLDNQTEYFNKEKKTLLGSVIANELKDNSRIVHQEETSVAFIPEFARYPYEVWIAPKRSVASLTEFTDQEFKDFARTLKTVLLKYDGLWEKKFPYLMLLYAAPTDGKAHPEWHFHIQFNPPLRTKDRLKYLAGTELGAGIFINDTVPEEKAAELKNVKIQF